MARTGISLRIHGAMNARGHVIRFRETTKERIVDILDSATPEAVERMREDIYARYTQGEGSTASSLVGEVAPNREGAAVRIMIGGFKQVKYMTSLLSDSEFRAGPYVITPRKRGGRMNFYWKRLGRKVSLRRVTHPGFGPQDVIRQAAERELSILGYLVEYQVRSAVAEVQSGGRNLRVSGRR